MLSSAVASVVHIPSFSVPARTRFAPKEKTARATFPNLPAKRGRDVEIAAAAVRCVRGHLATLHTETNRKTGRRNFLFISIALVPLSMSCAFLIVSHVLFPFAKHFDHPCPSLDVVRFSYRFSCIISICKGMYRKRQRVEKTEKRKNGTNPSLERTKEQQAQPAAQSAIAAHYSRF